MGEGRVTTHLLSSLVVETFLYLYIVFNSWKYKIFILYNLIKTRNDRAESTNLFIYLAICFSR